MSDIPGKSAADIEKDPASQAHIAKQQAEYAASQKQTSGPTTYPREFNAHTRWVDSTNGHEFIGTQYSYNSEPEALTRIDSTRAANKYVMCMDDKTGAFVLNNGTNDYRITVED